MARLGERHPGRGPDRERAAERGGSQPERASERREIDVRDRRLGEEDTAGVDARVAARTQALLGEGQLGAKHSVSRRDVELPATEREAADDDVVEDSASRARDICRGAHRGLEGGSPGSSQADTGRHHREAGERRRAERRLRASPARPGPRARRTCGDAERIDGELGHIDPRPVQVERGAQPAERPRPELDERGREGSGAAPRSGCALRARRQRELAAPLQGRGQQRCQVFEARRRRADLRLELRPDGERLGRHTGPSSSRSRRPRSGSSRASPGPSPGARSTGTIAGAARRRSPKRRGTEAVEHARLPRPRSLHRGRAHRR